MKTNTGVSFHLQWNDEMTERLSVCLCVCLSDCLNIPSRLSSLLSGSMKRCIGADVGGFLWTKGYRLMITFVLE